ncbi:MAG: ribosomal protein S18-alanine N-acetyltransferase [Gammaproteobacteria bacterium]|jgi:ribosomal-protein-alanine acetyltransferase
MTRRIPDDVVIRPAVEEDLKELVRLEERCFETDRMSKRSFRAQIHSDHNRLLVAESNGRLLGYILIFMRLGVSMARLYSICVDPDAHGRGVGNKLMDAGEQAAAKAGRIFMRLEVRKDNDAAIALYKRRGYRQFGMYEDYYEDHADALRFHKRIVHHGHGGEHLAVPYYQQSTGFTCGSAALMMAMSALRPEFTSDQRSEFQIWREATTIFMTSGHGGCGPHGLAYAATKRNFQVDVYVNQEGPLFVEGVRDPVKKQVLEQVHEDFVEKLKDARVEVFTEWLTLYQLERALDDKAIPLVLISTYRFDRRKVPHWVVLVDMDEHFVYINDPDVDDEAAQGAVDNYYIPVPRASFDRMFQFGQNRLRCAVIIRDR